MGHQTAPLRIFALRPQRFVQMLIVFPHVVGFSQRKCEIIYGNLTESLCTSTLTDCVLQPHVKPSFYTKKKYAVLKCTPLCQLCVSFL